MSSDPGDQPNPFKGTPFEQIFAAFGGGGAGLPGMAGGMPDLSAIMGQVQAMMQPHEGAVNWNLAKDIARRAAAQEPDPSISSAEDTRIADALRLADHWLDSATELPSGVSTTVGWSRAEWIEQTTEVWRESIPRVDTLETLIQQQRFDLATPIAWTFAGGRFDIPA